MAGTPLDLGPAETLEQVAMSDFDGDGVVETRRGELDGLEGATVTVTFEDRSTRTVLTLDDLPYA